MAIFLSSKSPLGVNGAVKGRVSSSSLVDAILFQSSVCGGWCEGLLLGIFTKYKETSNCIIWSARVRSERPLDVSVDRWSLPYRMPNLVRTRKYDIVFGSRVGDTRSQKVVHVSRELIQVDSGWSQDINIGDVVFKIPSRASSIFDGLLSMLYASNVSRMHIFFIQTSHGVWPARQCSTQMIAKIVQQSEKS